MASLDSPLEFIAFRFVINNLWTWIAVVTAAAVSFWRLRATTVNNGGKLSIEEALIEPTKPPQAVATATCVVETSPRVMTVTEVKSPLFCNDGVTKGKLTVYYYEEEVRGIDDVDLTDVKYGDGESGEWWERVVRMRNGDHDGWYRDVDLTVINGSVVRLWNDDNGVRNGGWVSVDGKD
ncbi:unnamed protein product [Cochlearia groenlandica]